MYHPTHNCHALNDRYRYPIHHTAHHCRCWLIDHRPHHHVTRHNLYHRLNNHYLSRRIKNHYPLGLTKNHYLFESHQYAHRHIRHRCPCPHTKSHHLHYLLPYRHLRLHTPDLGHHLQKSYLHPNNHKWCRYLPNPVNNRGYYDL